MTKQKLDLERTMGELGKQFSKNHFENFKKSGNQFQNAACEQKTTSEENKFGSNKKIGQD